MKKLTLIFVATFLVGSVLANESIDRFIEANEILDIENAVLTGKSITREQQQELDKFYRLQEQRILDSQKQAAADFKTAQQNLDDRELERNAKLQGDSFARMKHLEELRQAAYRASRGQQGMIKQAKTKVSADVDNLLNGLADGKN